MPVVVHRTPHEAAHVALSRCSPAYFFAVLLRLITVVAPFVIAYAMNNFWLKAVSGDVQPTVRFTHQALVTLQSSTPDSTLLWSTEPHINAAYGARMRSSALTSYETDADRDGVPEGVDVTLRVPLKAGETVRHARCMLFFQYQISEKVKLDMQTLAYIDVQSPSSGRGAWVDAELRLRQRDVFAYESTVTYPSPLPSAASGKPTGSAELLHAALLQGYTARNVTTVLEHAYSVWSPGSAGSAADDVGFELKAHIRYPRETIRYRPGLWETLKYAWVQYVSLLLVVRYFTTSLQSCVFSNNVLETVVLRRQPRDPKPNF